MSDLRISLTLPDHPKVVKLIRLCGEMAFRCLIRLWTRAASDKPDGVLSGWDLDDIEIAAGWTGEPGQFAQALLQLRFLDEMSGVYCLHDWAEHNPWVAGAGSRSDQARLKALTRWNPQLAKELKKHGITAISAEEYQCLMDFSGTPKDAIKTLKKCQKMHKHADSNATALQEHCTSNAPNPIPIPSPNPIPNPIPNPTPKHKKQEGSKEPLSSSQGEHDPTPPKNSAPKAKKESVPIAEIVQILNEAAGTKYRASTQATRRHIKARWREGFRIDDFRAVIEHKVSEWGSDPKMRQYLRPETLFGSKFEGYLQAARLWKSGAGPPGEHFVNSENWKSHIEVLRMINEGKI